MDTLRSWLDQYDYFILFFTLMTELIILTLPGELLMSYAGFLVSEGKLNWLVSILVAGLGSSIGITFTYLIGFHYGAPFLKKHGQRVHLGPDKFEKASQWFEKQGNKVLLITYFIPGVRHISGYFSGITKIPYRIFAIYAYTGALIWTSTFITIGKFLGPKWEEFHASVKKYLLIGGIIIAIIMTVIYLIRTQKEKIHNR
ncbi:DedA family protein [Rubeoparvulum massiliense]|uniref:DedA family protein n=1 Tax=Rubeoparvulum massiliense TaxID=1631346 RepID=UPI00065E5C57|nr:DedA family protein [Rubeoparvulum massiliense]